MRPGGQILRHIKSLRVEELLPQIESEAMELLSEILQALDDETTEDPECFRRIAAIVQAYQDRGIVVLRHDW